MKYLALLKWIRDEEGYLTIHKPSKDVDLLEISFFGVYPHLSRIKALADILELENFEGMILTRQSVFGKPCQCIQIRYCLFPRTIEKKEIEDKKE